MAIRKYLGVMPQINQSSFVDPSAIVIGNVIIDEEVFVLPNVVIRGDVNSIRVGAYSNIQDSSVLHVNSDSVLAPGGSPLIIGSQVTVGHKVLLHGCTIGDHCLIGMGSIVMDRVVIDRDVIVGAGSLVTPGKHLESGFLYAGSPARQIRPLKDTEGAFIDYSYTHYNSLKSNHRDSVAQAGED
ncbi:MAG: carbonic anhydrase/acetyltransferase-like protein (isoleucine patch superfamily) [Gammaproteobacteria bacterium]|jgi:carbonic anhydrase/acetyltransferase-like protein (isoleucine patch superfamily)